MSEGRPVANEPSDGWEGHEDFRRAPSEPRLRSVPSGDQPNPFTEQLRSELLSTAQVKDLPPAEPLIAGILDLNTIASLIAPPGTGKSFLAIDLAQHVAHGSWWQGREVDGGPVVYVVAEGATGFSKRIRAWEQHNNLHQEVHPIHWLPRAVQLLDAVWAEAVAEVCAELRPSLVVVDTLARSIVGADENGFRDMSRAVDSLDRIRLASGACVLAVHHTGKDSTRGGRGHSSVFGALDTELELTGEGDRLTLKVTKQKDGRREAPTSLALIAVDGTESCAIGRPAQADPGVLPTGPAETLEALVAIDVPGGVGTTTWMKSSEKTERTFYRHRAGLLKQGLVVNIGTDQMPRYRPASALEAEA